MFDAPNGVPAAAPAGVPTPAPPAWYSKPITVMESGDPTKAGELLKPEKRGRGRPRIKQDDENKKHRDLGSYNLFVMKAQNVAGSDVKNHRAFMALIGSFWKGMDQETRDEFNSTYKNLLDSLNEKKKAGIKYDFAHELKVYERDNELDTIGYFKGFMAQVKKLPAPETKAERDAKEAAAKLMAHPEIPLPAAEEEDDEEDDSDEDDDDDDEPAPVVKKEPVVVPPPVAKKKDKKRAEPAPVVAPVAPAAEEPKKKKKKKDKAAQ